MRLKRFAVALALSLPAGAAAYAALIRPVILRWGATDEDTVRLMPGDDIVGNPRYRATHAITIGASAAEIWPWLVQIGQDRGGFYSYDRLEVLFGLDIQSANHIVPELQHLRAGDIIRLTPEGPGEFWLEARDVIPERALVLKSPGSPEKNARKGRPFASWAFLLEDDGGGGTRLIARMQADFKPDLAGLIINKYALEPIHAIMEMKMLKGIKERAEGTGLMPTAAVGSDAGLEEAAPGADRAAA